MKKINDFDFIAKVVKVTTETLILQSDQAEKIQLLEIKASATTLWCPADQYFLTTHLWTFLKQIYSYSTTDRNISLANHQATQKNIHNVEKQFGCARSNPQPYSWAEQSLTTTHHKLRQRNLKNYPTNHLKDKLDPEAHYDQIQPQIFTSNLENHIIATEKNQQSTICSFTPQRHI